MNPNHNVINYTCYRVIAADNILHNCTLDFPEKVGNHISSKGENICVFYYSCSVLISEFGIFPILALFKMVSLMRLQF